MRCRTRLIAIALAAALILPLSAAAQAQCIKQVDDMATALGMSTTLPEPADLAGEPDAAAGDDAVSELAESQGVIAPPDTGDQMPVLEPSAGQDSNMVTAPDIEATPPPEGDPEADRAAALMQVESLLTAAREAADAADEDGCLDRLQEAAALAAANGLPLPQ